MKEEEEVTDKLCHFRIMPHENEQNTLLQLEVIKFVSDLQHVCGFSSWTVIFYTVKTDRHDKTEILLKVSLTLILKNIVNLAIQYR